MDSQFKAIKVFNEIYNVEREIFSQFTKEINELQDELDMELNHIHEGK
jgi:hypothetical protein